MNIKYENKIKQNSEIAYNSLVIQTEKENFIKNQKRNRVKEINSKYGNICREEIKIVIIILR